MSGKQGTGEESREEAPWTVPSTAPDGEHRVGSPPLEHVLEELARAAAASLETDRAALLLWREGSGEPPAAVLVGLTEEFGSAFAGLQDSRRNGGRPPPARIVADTGAMPRAEPLRCLCEDAGIRAAWTVPLALRGENPSGALSLFFPRPRVPTEADLARLRAFAELAAAAVEEKAPSVAPQGGEDAVEAVSILEAFLDSAPVGLALLDQDLRYQRVNPALAAINGSPVEMHLGRTVSEVIPQLADTVAPVLRKVMETGEPIVNVEMNGRTAAAPGEERCWLVSQFPIRDPDGEILGVGVAVKEITDLKRMESAVRESESRYRRITETAFEGVWTIDAAERATYVNRRLCEMLGYDAEEILGRWVFEFHFPEDRERARAPLERLRQGHPVQFELRLRRKDGSELFVVANGMPIFSPEGTYAGALGMFTDVTDRTRAEAALRESERRYRRLLDTAHEGIWTTDAGGRATYANQRLAEMLGYSQDNLLGRHFTEFVYPEDQAAAARLFEERRAGRTLQTDYRVRRADGSPLWVIAAVSPILSDGGEFQGTLGMVMDVTEQKRAEDALREAHAALERRVEARTRELAEANDLLRQEAAERERLQATLRESEQFSRTVLGALTAHIAVLDGRGIIVAVNPAWEQFSRKNAGLPWRTGIGVDYLQVCREARGPHAEGADRAEAGIRAVLDGTRTEFEMEYACPSRTEERWFLLRATPLPWPQGGAVVTHINVSELKRAEQALRESEARYRRIVETANEGIWTVDHRGVTTHVNRRMAEMLGFCPEEMVGRPSARLLFPEDYAEILRQMEAQSRGLPGQFDIRLRRKDGSELWALVCTSPVLDDRGHFSGVVAMVTDVTERHATEEALRESERRSSEAARRARLGFWEWDIVKNTVTWSEEMYRAYGLEPGKFRATYEAYLNRVHPEDRERARRIIETALGSRRPYEYESRILRPDGSVRMLHCRGEVLLDERGEPVCLKGTAQDITERWEADQALAAARQRVLEAEVAQRRFYREVIRAVTQDRFHLVDAGEIPDEGAPVLELSLDGPENYAALRRVLNEAARSAGMEAERVEDLVLAAGEAATNAIKYGIQSTACVYVIPDRVIARVADRGPGIRPEDLPSTLLRPGFSTTVSLGMGYTLMLGLVDRLWLSTGPEGTIVQVEKWIHPEEQPDTTLLTILDRF